MKTRRIVGWTLAAWACGLTAGPTVALAGPTESSTEDVLAYVRRIRPGQIETYYFEAKQADKTIGYAIVSLRGDHYQGEPVIRYKNESSVKVDEKSRLTLVSNAVLKYNFEPVKIEIGGTATTPAGIRRTPNLQISVNDQEKEIKIVAVPQLVSKSDGIQPQYAPMPNGHFVYALDGLIHVIDFSKFKLFKMPEYIPQDGSINMLTYTVEPQTDGTMLVNLTREDGQQDYKFWFDKEGRLDHWGEPPFELLLYRSTKDAVDKLKAGYEKELAVMQAAAKANANAQKKEDASGDQKTGGKDDK